MYAHFNNTLGFLSTPSARRATRYAARIAGSAKFLSTPSARRATVTELDEHVVGGISIHALREEGDARIPCDPVPRERISIHALREEGDLQPHRTEVRLTDFYPRPPRGGRPRYAARIAGSAKFLSTPSARRATAKTETKSLFSNKLYNILHEFRRALIYNGSKSYPNHAK